MKRACGNFSIAVLAFGAWGAAVRADADRDRLGTALAFAGFDLIGQHNPLSGGFDFLATNDFDGSAFDFGAWELAFQGPVSLQVSTGGRVLRQFDVSFTTAVNADTAAAPLGYAFSYDLGPQEGQVVGSVLADANFSINKLGFYDLDVTYSSRRETTTAGSLSNDTSTRDYDLGPIRVSGNIYADVLALITDPFFDRAGATNVFASFSSNEVLNGLLTGSSTNLEELVAAAQTSTLEALSQAGLNGALTGTQPPVAKAVGAAVPEPAVLLLMLLGLPAILARRRRRAPQVRP